MATAANGTRFSRRPIPPAYLLRLRKRAFGRAQPRLTVQPILWPRRRPRTVSYVRCLSVLPAARGHRAAGCTHLTPRTWLDADATPDHARTCAYLLDGLGTLGGFRKVRQTAEDIADDPKPGGLDIGLDPILSLFAPLLGDFVGLLLGLYVIFLGSRRFERPR